MIDSIQYQQFYLFPYDHYGYYSYEFVQSAPAQPYQQQQQQQQQICLKKSSRPKSFDAINNCKSAGIIPYTIHDSTLFFLFQQNDSPIKRKESGWNDFGGKQLLSTDTTAETASREFNEETSCLFYLKSIPENNLYSKLKNNPTLLYSEKTISELQSILPSAQKFFADKITEFPFPLHVSSKETYISYFVRVPYIDENDIPKAEDIHINYENRYLRTVRWFTISEILLLKDKDFHKRLQITRIQQRIQNYFEKGMFL